MDVERRLVEEMWNEGDLSVADETHDSAMVVHWEREFSDLEEMKAYVSEVRKGCPDFHMDVAFTVADDDRVTVGWTATGTNTDEMRGIPATGRFFRISGMWTHRFVDGKVVEGWSSWDAYGLREQLGLTFPRVLVTLPWVYAKRLYRRVRSGEPASPQTR